MIAHSEDSSRVNCFDDLLEAGDRAAYALLRAWSDDCRSRKIRSIIEFAEQEIRLPEDGGPYEGQSFRADLQPYVRLLYDEILSGRWSEVFICGPSQSGKTLCAFVILLVYIAVELRRNVGVCLPDENMISDKWTIDIQPVFQANPKLAQLLPVSGPGSRSGVVKESVLLRNGVMIKFYTPGGSDQSKAGFTSPYIVGTEAAGFSKSTSTSREADPLRQIRARQRSKSRYNADGTVNSDRLLTFEGTVTVEEDLPWRMKAESSDSAIVCQCVHCKEWVTPEREHFGGWEEAKDEFEAARSGVFCCPSCGEVYTPDHRLEMNRGAKLLHKGQSINKKGTINGELPKTTTLFFRWSAWNNLFVREMDLAAEEWQASNLEPETEEYENAQKDLSQSIWCLPYAPKMVGTSKLSRTDVRQRTSLLPPLVIPDDAVHVTVGVDLGRWQCWFYVIAARANGSVATIGFAQRDTGLQVPKGENVKLHESIAITATVNGILDEVLERGFAVESGGIRTADMVFVDSGYMPDAAIAAVRGRDKVKCVIGRGKSQMQSMKYSQPKKVGGTIRKLGDGFHVEFNTKRGWHIFFDADRSKLEVQAALRVTPGAPGSLTLTSDPKENIIAARHLASEVYRRYIDPKKGLVEAFNKSGQNHLLDCCGMAWVALRYLGWVIPSVPLLQSENENQDGSTPTEGNNHAATKTMGSWLTRKRGG